MNATSFPQWGQQANRLLDEGVVLSVARPKPDYLHTVSLCKSHKCRRFANSRIIHKDFDFRVVNLRRFHLLRRSKHDLVQIRVGRSFSRVLRRLRSAFMVAL